MNALDEFILAENDKRVDFYWEAFAKEVMAAQTPETFTLLFATDPHYIRRYPRYVPALRKVEEMVAFTGKVGVDLLAITGDLADGNVPLDLEYRDLYDLVSVVRGAKSRAVVLSRGNHDDCAWFACQHDLPADGSVITDEQWYTHVVNPIRVQYPILTDDQNPAAGYYAVDDPVHKIRVLNLNTSDMPWVLNDEGKFYDRSLVGQWCFGLREKQLRWIARMLQLPDEGWSVLFMSHACPFKCEEPVHNADLFAALIDAYRDGTKGTLTSEDAHFPATVPFDFTANRSHDLLPYLYGHVHRDEVSTAHGLTLVATQNLLGAINPPGSTTGHFDCMLLDKVNRVLTCKRCGLPEQNREIRF